MSRKLAFLVAAALALTITAANAAPLNPAMRTLAAGTSLVLETHGCHKLCVTAPYGGYPHGHAMFSCEPAKLLRIASAPLNICDTCVSWLVSAYG
jgi:hypothetical protein